VADAETLAIASAGYRAIGFPRLRILVNDRTLFDQLGLSKPEVIAVDKLAKIGADGVVRELVQLGRAESEARDLLERLRESRPGPRLEEVMATALDLGMPAEDLEYDPTLARGLEYYTSTVLEVTSPDYTAGSLGGGGRYDGLIRRFTGQDIPAVGFSFGLERVIEALEAVGAFQDFRAAPVAVAIALGRAQLGWAGQVATRLRAAGVSVAMGADPDGGAGKQIGAAAKLGARYAVLVGDAEAGAGKATLKDLASGEQETLDPDDLLRRLRPASPAPVQGVQGVQGDAAGVR
jgi:histidyl-tRNA synthetase